MRLKVHSQLTDRGGQIRASQLDLFRAVVRGCFARAHYRLPPSSDEIWARLRSGRSLRGCKAFIPDQTNSEPTPTDVAATAKKATSIGAPRRIRNMLAA